MRKSGFCLCDDKGPDQLRSYCEADQRLCLRYTDSTIPLLSKSGISSLYPSSVLVQLGLFRTWSETPKSGFLVSRLMCCSHRIYGDNKCDYCKYMYNKSRCNQYLAL